MKRSCSSLTSSLTRARSMTTVGCTSSARRRGSDRGYGHGLRPVAILGVAVRCHQPSEPRLEWLERLCVVHVTVDRAVVQLLGDLRVAWGRCIAAIFMKAQAGSLEWQPEIVEKLPHLTRLVCDEGFIIEH